MVAADVKWGCGRCQKSPCVEFEAGPLFLFGCVYGGACEAGKAACDVCVEGGRQGQCAWLAASAPNPTWQKRGMAGEGDVTKTADKMPLVLSAAHTAHLRVSLSHRLYRHLSLLSHSINLIDRPPCRLPLSSTPCEAP